MEEDSSLEEVSEVYDEQNVMDVLNDDLSERHQQAFKKKGAAQISPQREKLSSLSAGNSKGKYFFSKGAQMNIYGQKFQTFILVTSKRFCYFDTKVRLEKYLPLAHIKEFTFLIENPNVFIIKPAASEALSSNKHIVNDMIFLTRNTSRLQAFLAHLRQTNKFAVTFRKAQHAWLKVYKEEYNLGMGVPTYNNPFRIALAGQPVFYGQVKEDGIWASKSNAVLVVQPMGVACFHGQQIYELENKRELACFLPIT